MTQFLCADAKTDVPFIQTINGFCILSQSALEQTSRAGEGFEAAIRGLKSDQPAVIPRGESGNFVWSQLPSDLAVLAVDPLQTAIIAIPQESVAGDDAIVVWEWLAHNASSLVVLPGTEGVASFDYPELAPKRPSTPRWLRDTCQNFTLGCATSETELTALKAGLLQLHDELDRSHEHSQSIEGEGRNRTGDYWHGIMHRREPDYGNSKYWFRRVGEHPIYPLVAEQAAEILGCCDSPDASSWQRKLTHQGWDPFAFVDLCQVCARTSDAELIYAVKKIQWMEMILLLAQNHQDATMSSGQRGSK